MQCSEGCGALQGGVGEQLRKALVRFAKAMDLETKRRRGSRASEAASARGPWRWTMGGAVFQCCEATRAVVMCLEDARDQFLRMGGHAAIE